MSDQAQGVPQPGSGSTQQLSGLSVFTPTGQTTRLGCFPQEDEGLEGTIPLTLMIAIFYVLGALFTMVQFTIKTSTLTQNEFECGRESKELPQMEHL